MPDPTRLSVRYEDGGDSVRCFVDVSDPVLLGHAAELRIKRTVVVHDSRGVDETQVVARARIGSLDPTNPVVFSRADLSVYSYSGSMIDIAIRSEVEVDDGLVFDTTVTRDEQIILGRAPAVASDAKEIVEPADAFDFITNLRAVPPINRFAVILLAIFGAAVIGFNSWVGIHDEFSPDALVWFYDHRDSEGDSESPFLKSLALSGFVGAGVWAAMQSQLRRYMIFRLYTLPATICREDELDPGAIVHGRPRVDLHDVVVRIVACNMEKGQYERGSGTKKRTVSFTNPVRAVILYDKRIPLIPAGRRVEQYLDGKVRFEPMFRALYPPQNLSSTHGLTVHWEVQLIHDELVDQELIGPIECFPWEEFLDA